MTRRPRIAVDATVLSNRVKGAGRVVRNLIPALATIDPDSTYVVLTTEAGAEKLDQVTTKFEVALVPPMRGIQWELTGLNRSARRCGADLALTFREFVGFGAPPIVMHVFEPPAHRLQFAESRRSIKHVAKDRFLHLSMKGSIRRAAAVTAGSESTAVWYRQNHGIDPAVIHPGIDEQFLMETALVETTDRAPYFLHLASGDTRDNTDLVLEAFARLGHQATTIRMVGVPDNLRAVIQRRSRELGIAGQVHVEGWVSDARLRDLYGRAEALIHPSSHEGFCGYPSLEAMAMGTPVVALASPGAEALAGRALLIDRPNPELLANALLEIIDKHSGWPTIAQRAQVWARSLTWEATATQFVSVFRRVLKIASS